MVQCEVKIGKTHFGQIISFWFVLEKQVNVGMVAWSPDGKQLAVLRSDEHEVDIITYFNFKDNLNLVQVR